MTAPDPVARLGVWGRSGKTFAGYLPTKDLRFSDELGGSGTCSYTARYSDIEALDAWDTVLKVELWTGDAWVLGPAYAARHVYTHPGGWQRFNLTNKALLEVWASETVVLPEYVIGAIPRLAGEERGIGWMMSAYAPGSDPYEPWDKSYDTGRTERPDGWPSGSGAKWISVSGATDPDYKYFRSWVTITGTSWRQVQFWLSSDESTDLWVGGEKVLSISGTDESGKGHPTVTHKTTMYPGTYAVGVRSESVYSKGGTGEDPVIVAGAILGSDGKPASWIIASDENSFAGCHRNSEPPDDLPPGPSPGAALRYLVQEAKDRNCSGWPNVTMDFTATKDSYGVNWGNRDVSERIYRYGLDTYWDIFQGMGESDDCDIWMTADLVLHCAPRQGRQSTVISLTEQHMAKFASRTTDNERGTWIVAKYTKGWVFVNAADGGAIRRESALEIGQTQTKPVTEKIIKAGIRDHWRWDGAARLNPPKVTAGFAEGWFPYVDLQIGDRVDIDYKGIHQDVTIISWSAEAGEGGLLWDIEVTEWLASIRYPSTALLRDGRTSDEGGIYDGLENVPLYPDLVSQVQEAEARQAAESAIIGGTAESVEPFEESS